MIDNKHKKAVWTMHGTIVGASRVQDFKTKHGKHNQSAVLHIQENENEDGSPEVAVKVSGDLCSYAGCIGMRVVVCYVVRVFEFMKNGIMMLGNDIYATSINMI